MGEKMKQCISYLETSKEPMIQLGGRYCNILIDFSIPMKLVRLINMCLNETYSRFRVGKYLPDIFPIKNDLKHGEVLSPFLFNFALVYAIRRVQVNHKVLKLNGTNQLLVYADDVNIVSGNVHTRKMGGDGLD
jgi:hypothetical protein